jgi:AcrR family transcriptional regulator
MAYRHTEKTLAHKAAVKEGLLAGAMALVAEGGFGALTVAAAAQQAGMATGAVYKHFESTAALCAEVFRRATEKEVAMVRMAATAVGSPPERLRQAISTFAGRALRGRRLAYALIAEPVDPLVDVERLRFRHAYAEIFQALVEDGVRAGAFAVQTPSVSAAALVGVIAEAMVGPLSWQHDYDTPEAQTPLIAAIQSFCLRAVGASLDKCGRAVDSA